MVIEGQGRIFLEWCERLERDRCVIGSGRWQSSSAHPQRWQRLRLGIQVYRRNETNLLDFLKVYYLLLNKSTSESNLPNMKDLTYH
jgi:hypothetical protein